MWKRDDRPNADVFEQWCETQWREAQKPDVANKVKACGFAEYLKKQGKGGDIGEAAQAYSRWMTRLAREQRGRIAAVINASSGAPTSVKFDMSGGTPLRALKADSVPHFYLLEIQYAGHLRLTDAVVRGVVVGSERAEVVLERCCIATLDLTGGGKHAGNHVTLRNCWVGRLQLRTAFGIATLTVEGGSIRSIDCPAPEDSNPFTGSVTFKSVEFPTSRRARLLRGPQGYRSLRAHSSSLPTGKVIFCSQHKGCSRLACLR